MAPDFIDKVAQRSQQNSSMGIAIYGLMRTGTTLASDLLTVRGKSLVVAEPDLFVEWHPQTIARVHRALKNFGPEFESLEEPTDVAEHGSYFAYFNKHIVPILRGLNLWGIKHVSFRAWRELLAYYKPRRLVLCVRDIRDAVLSQIEFAARNRLAFPGGRHMRDEAWVMLRYCHDAHHIRAMAAHPHLLLRYEDFVADSERQEMFRTYAGLTRLSDDRINLAAEPGGNRAWETEKHKGGITTASIGRFEKEPHGPARVVAERTWRMLASYCKGFSYEAPPLGMRLDDHPFAAKRSGDMPPVEPWQMNLWDWRGPMVIEPAFARRRARIAAVGLIPEGEAVLDLGCGVPVLAYMLARNCSYQGADVVKRYEGCLVSDFAKGKVPDARAATLITALGLLEFLADVPGFLKAIRSYDLPAVVTYHANDDTPGTDRRDLGWLSHLNRTEFLQACAAAGFETRQNWAFDGHQSIFELHPA